MHHMKVDELQMIELVGFDIDMAAWFEDYLTEEEGVTYSLEFKQMSFDNIITQVGRRSDRYWYLRIYI